MKGKKEIRPIRIPLWINNAVSELAIEHKRDVNGEIEYLVEAAIKNRSTDANQKLPKVAALTENQQR
jgi:hypothetical protein